MNDEKPKSWDILGLKPVSEAIETIIKDASEFLKLICFPAAQEYGLLLQDKVRFFRMKNTVNIIRKTKEIMNKQYDDINLIAMPRIVSSILENGSWIDDDKIQEMWAGLLASSCTKDGKDESNLIFINLLSQLTSSEVKILNYICENAEKKISAQGLIYASTLLISLMDLQKITGIFDIHHLDRELDHLRSLGLTEGGFPQPEPEPSKKSISTVLKIIEADGKPSALALNMYVRCKGSLQTPVKYFGLEEEGFEH